MKNREFSLLTKTTFIYLIFTFVAFVSSAMFLTHETNEFIDRDVEIQFKKLKHKTNWYLRNRDGVPDRMRHVIHVQPITGGIDTSAYPQYIDTVMVNPYSDDQERYRRKTTIIRTDSLVYKATFTESIEDYLRLKDDIYGSLIPAFILLAIAIVVFNLLLSGILFRPFNAILETMRTYKVGQSPAPDMVETNTKEFNRMQELFHQMLMRIEDDYQNLKEYTENMSHEIQTPLAVLRNKTENLIDDESVMDQHGDDIKILWDEANHLSKLGNTLNLITKIENREFEDFQTIQTKPVLLSHIRKIEEFSTLKTLEFERDLSDDHYVEIDPYLLDILLKNLLWNAVRYATDDGPIRVCTAADTLTISNYGPPLNFPEEKLFERFYQPKTDSNSLGLGLAIVQKICDINNLEIEYEYAEGQHIFRINKSK